MTEHQATAALDEELRTALRQVMDRYIAERQTVLTEHQVSVIVGKALVLMGGAYLGRESQINPHHGMQPAIACIAAYKMMYDLAVLEGRVRE